MSVSYSNSPAGIIVTAIASDGEGLLSQVGGTLDQAISQLYKSKDSLQSRLASTAEETTQFELTARELQAKIQGSTEPLERWVNRLAEVQANIKSNNEKLTKLNTSIAEVDAAREDLTANFATKAAEAQALIAPAEAEAANKKATETAAANQTAGEAVTKSAPPQSASTTPSAQPPVPSQTDGAASSDTAAKNSTDNAVTADDDAKIKSAENSRETTVRVPPRPATPNADDATSASASVESKEITKTGSESVTPVTTLEIPHPQANPLHKYATYTYNLTLFVLSHDNYNELVNGTATSNWTPSYSLISSAGGYHENRHPLFREDFYFDNLKMKTIVGQTELTRGTNMVEMDFTVIEPYGLTLMDRLVELSYDPSIDGSGNYVAQPYLLQIDFFGSDDLGKTSHPIPHLRKRMPINFITFKIKVGTRGTEYAIKAIPYNHIALMEATNSTPANFEIKSGTVGDFFKDVAAASLVTQMATKEQARNDAILAAGITKDDYGNDILQPGQRVGLGGDAKKLDAALKVVNSPYSVESYTGAWNAWNQKLVDDGHATYANEIEFVFVPDDVIKDSPIVDPKKMPYSRSNMPPPGTDSKKAAAQSNNKEVSSKTPSNSFDPKTMLFNVTSGTSVVDVINLVMRNSDYIKNQVKDPLSDKTDFETDKTIDYFRIIPKVTLKEFDPLRNEFAFKTTYFIKKYSYYNSKHPNMPKAKPRGAVKEYDYIYTGKNIDIIDLAIDFDSAFFTTITINREKAEATSGATGASNGEGGKDNPKKPIGNKTLTPMVHKFVSSDASVQATGADTAKTVLVANAMKSIYSGSRGDMLSVKLKIIGDPHFIKQDDIYTNPGMSGYNDTKFMLNEGTINMDSGEFFCNINFRTPIDMDDTTGLAKFNSNYEKSRFTGFYKVQIIDSEFSKGQFVQTLDLIRIFEDADEYSKNTPRLEAAAAAARTEFAATDPRLIKSDTNATTTDATDKKELPAQPVVKEEKVLSRQAIPKIANTNPEESTAASEGQKIGADMAGAKEVDVTAQKTADAASPQPQNPTAAPPPAVANAQLITDLKAQLATNESQRTALAAQLGPATDAAQQAYNTAEFFNPAGKTYSANWTGTFNGQEFSDPALLYQTAKADFQAKADKRTALATEFNALFPVKAQLENDIANASGSPTATA